MTDLTKELNRSQGIPFLEYKQFVTRTFFPKVGSPLVNFTMVTVVEQNNGGGTKSEQITLSTQTHRV